MKINLILTSVLGFLLFLKPLAFAGDTEKVLLNVQGSTYGKYPESLVVAADGTIYGTLNAGGTPTCNVNCGLVYKLAPNSNGVMTETIIHTFTGKNDGAQPTRLFMDTSGNLFVSAYAGGVSGTCVQGCGAIIELLPLPSGGWGTKILYDFQGSFDGEHPTLTLLDSQGNLYGTTRNGQVWELSKLPGGIWKKKFLYLFDTNDAYLPLPEAVDASGNVYGSAVLGGNTSCSDGCGIIFELSPASNGIWTETTLYSFAGPPDGGQPGAIFLDGNGNIFGITQQGGAGTKCGAGCGTLFELSPSSAGYTESVLHSFNEVLDGYSPQALLSDGSGNIYVANLGGGVAGRGTVLEFTLGSDGIWEYTTLYSFAGGNGGGEIYTIALDQFGNIFGIGGQGGSKGEGVVFELSPLE